MIQVVLLFLAILGSVMLLSFLYFLVVSASDSAAEVTESRKTAENNTDQRPGERNPEKAETLRAVIHCAYCPPEVPVRFRAEGYTECNTLNMVFGGNLSCGKGCFGLGSCALICPNDAFVFRKGRVYISDACNGCGHCVHVCPKKLIEIVPVSSLPAISCAACGLADMPDSCHAALEQNNGAIDYRKFPVSGFKILHKWGILGQKSRQE